ncbi:hypothetical protein Q8F55_008232 [Vanrija albida]|uniref:Uncharacterized protein n=1 Tax=Vanrija albida TaxID=181172 RepID=A0ABR3PVP2_9TREE
MPSSVSGLVAALQDGSAAPSDDLATKLIRGWVYERMRRGRTRVDVAYSLDEVQSSIGLNKYEAVFTFVRETYQLPALGEAVIPPPPPPPMPASPRPSPTSVASSTASVIAALTEPHPGRPRNLNYAAGVLRAYIAPRLARSTPHEMGRRLDAIERVMEFEERRFEHAFIAVRDEFGLPDSTVFAEHGSQKVGAPCLLPPGAAPAVLARPSASRQHSTPSTPVSPSPPSSYAFPNAPPLPSSSSSHAEWSPSPSWDSRHSSPLACGPSPGPVPAVPSVHATPKRPSPPATAYRPPPLPPFEPTPRHTRTSLPTAAAFPPVPPLSIGRSAGRALLASASSTSTSSASVAHSHSPDLSMPSSTPSTSPSTPSITPPTPSVATLPTPPAPPRPPTPPLRKDKPERGYIDNLLLFPRRGSIPDLTPRDVTQAEPIPDLTPRLHLVPDLTQRLQLDFGELTDLTPRVELLHDLTPRAGDAPLRAASPAPPVPPKPAPQRARIPEPQVASSTPPPVAFEATASALPPANTGPLPASHPFARALGRARSDSTASTTSAPSTTRRDSEASTGSVVAPKVAARGYGDLDVVALRRVHERRVGEAERLVREAEDAARNAHEARRVAEDAARRADEAKGRVEEMRARLRRVEASVGLSSTSSLI